MSAPHPERLDLTAEQQDQVLAAAGQLVRDSVFPQDAVRTPLPDELARLAVSGVFVSLKRSKHLRSCCGGLLNRPAELGQALADATARTVLEDSRFPPVSPTELPYLDMEVWLLCNPQRISVRGEERVQAVITGGKHGLVVGTGPSRGLLLPGVAKEHGWDARTFLEQVCIKAGLHPSLWKEESTTLITFEGTSISGKIQVPVDAGPGSANGDFLSGRDVAGLADWAKNNLVAFLRGATPRYYANGLPDGTVSGLVVGVSHGLVGEGWQLQKTGLHQGMALQASLFQLIQMAAQTLAQRRLTDLELGTLAVRLTILLDPAMHGTVRDADLRGLDDGRRAILVLQGARTGLVYDPRRTADELLAEASAQVLGKDSSSGAVFSLEAHTTEQRLVFSAGPKPWTGPAVRPPAVAGGFYSADPAKLFEMVDELLGAERQPRPWRAAMVPHAGLRFSGRVAAAVFRRLQIPATVIVIGPKHTALGMDWAVAPHQHWSLPGATLPADPDLAAALARAIPGLELDAAAHQREHGIEVELPFLARLAPQTRVVGIAVGPGTPADCERIADGLAQVLRRREEQPLLLISSDMNHFASDAETRRLDELALTALDRLDPDGLHETVTRNHVTMCGVLPAMIVLETLRRLGGLNHAERVSYATSADVTGDPSRVVGYAGMLFR